MSSSVKH